MDDMCDYIDNLFQSKFILLHITAEEITLLKECSKNRITDHRIALAIINKVLCEILVRRDLIALTIVHRNIINIDT
jgi:hypothetical protein